LDAGEELERHRLDRHLRHGEKETEHREPERDRHRHAGEHQAEEQHEDDGRGHLRTSRGCRLSFIASGTMSTSLTSSMPSTWPWSWCGSSPVRQNDHATCRKRKHIRYEPQGTARNTSHILISRTGDTWSVCPISQTKFARRVP